MAAKSFGRYRLVRLLARGGMAEVYLAVLRGAAGFEKRLVIKKILPIYGDLEEFTRLFTDEARISVSLSHSNIVQVFDFGLNDGAHFIAMEYVDGPDLEKVLIACRKLKTQLSIDALLYAATRVAAALEYAHSRNDDRGRSLQLVHRDVSPPNVLLSVEGEVKLTDFGVAKYQQRLSKSRPGVVRGKYAYMSPEQLTGQPIDNRSDLFGFGTVLYEMLTAKNPFLGPTDYQTMEAVVAANPQNPLELRSDAPHDLIRIVQRCLAGDADARYQRAGDIRRDLAELMFNRGVIDDPLLLMEELWRLFPRQLKRRGGDLPEVRHTPRPAPSGGAAALGMPRMRAGKGVSPVDEWGRKPGGGNMIQLGPADEDHSEDDATIPALADQDVVPTQPLQSASHTLESPPRVRSLARPAKSVPDPLGASAPARRKDAPRPRIEVRDPFLPGKFDSTDPGAVAFDAAAPTMERPHEGDDESSEDSLSLDDVELPMPAPRVPMPDLAVPPERSSAEDTQMSAGPSEDEFAYLEGVAAPGDPTMLSYEPSTIPSGDQTLPYTGPPADLGVSYADETEDEDEDGGAYPDTADPAAETLLELPAPSVPILPPPIPRRGGLSQTVPSAEPPQHPPHQNGLRPWTQFEEAFDPEAFDPEAGDPEATLPPPLDDAGDEPPTDEAVPAVSPPPVPPPPLVDARADSGNEAAPVIESPPVPARAEPPRPRRSPPPASTLDEGSPWPVIAAAIVAVILVFLFRGSISGQNEALLDDLGDEPPTEEAVDPSPAPEVEEPDPDPSEDPGTAEPASADPASTEPATAEPGTAEPATAEPGTDSTPIAEPPTADPTPAAPRAESAESATPSPTPAPVRADPTPAVAEVRTPEPRAAATPAPVEVATPALVPPEPAFETSTPPPSATPTPETPEPAFSPGAADDRRPSSEYTVPITVDSRPRGARLTIRGDLVGSAPQKVWGKPGEILEVSASLDGYLKTTRMLRVTEGDESTLIELSPEPSVAPSAEAELGKLVITSNPWAYVTLDGRQLGRVTPVTLDLEPGRHTVVLDNPDTGWSEARIVTVEASKTLKLDVKR